MKPKKSKKPDFAHILADPAGFATAVLGMDLYPKQSAVLHALMQPGCRISFRSCNEGGKALALDTPIPTPSGWTTMGALQVDDIVYGSDGKECKVTFATPVMLDHECFKVVFSDGSEVIADAGHLWETDYTNPIPGQPMGRCRSRHVVTTKHILETLRYSRGRTWGGAAHSIDLCSIDGREIASTISPYVLGAWLGDGSTGSPSMTCDVSELGHFVSELSQAGYSCTYAKDKRSNAHTIRFRVGTQRLNLAKEHLRQEGVLRRKHIPSKWLRASRVQRIALLQGLMDTDGYADNRGHCEFVSINRDFASQVLELALSLGFKAALRVGKAMCNGKDCGLKYRVCFLATRDMKPFRLARKLMRLPLSWTSERPATKRFIVAVNPVPSVPVRCIQVDSKDHCFLVGNGFIKTHNTARVIAGAILWHLAMFPMGRIISTSGSFRQVKDQLVPALHIYRTRFPRFKFFASPRIETEHVNGFWEGFSTNDSGKFEGHHEDGPLRPLMIIVDEAKTVSDEIFQAVERCKPTRLLIASSPGYAEGEFYRSHTTKSQFYTTFKQSANECAHWKPEAIAALRDKWGSNHPLVRSMLDAEFMEMVEDAIIELKALENLIANPPPEDIRGERKAFCDFSWGGDGDENVLALRRGNLVTLEECFRADNLHAICGRFIAGFARLGLKPWEIEGDEGGGGKLIIDQLASMGWSIGRVNNGSAPRFDEHYASVAAEMWFEGAGMIQRREVILPDDDDLRGQLLDRKRVPHNKGKLAIESKRDMRLRNVPSPDRADAVLGAMSPLINHRSVMVMGNDRELASDLIQQMEVVGGGGGNVLPGSHFG